MIKKFGFLAVVLGLSAVSWAMKKEGVKPLNELQTVLIQFDALPSAQAHDRLRDLGVELHYYLGSTSYLAEIPGEITAADLEFVGVTAVTDLSPRKKLSNTLFNGIYPAHAVPTADQIHLTVVHSSSMPIEAMEVQMQAHAWEITKRHTHRHAWDVIIPIQDLETLAAINWIWYIEPIEEPAVPENHRGRTNHRVNTLGTDYSGGLQFNGQGVNVAMGDDGIIGPHIDYQGRIDQQYSDPSSGNHGDHVAGIVMGAGNMERRGRGNASGAFLYVYEPFANVDSALNHYYTHNIRLTTTSYGNGCNAGYTSYASYADQTVRLRPKLMHVFSAGNSGTSNCGYGAGSGWGNITGGIKVGKNVLAVGNVQFTDQIANSSSRGPSADGRVKPDVCAVGTSVYSTIDVNDYASFTGTSMACPGVTGTLAVLYNAYEALYGEDPISALMKGVLMNTAEDLGNSGPDFTYGYGRINARRAYDVIEAGQFMIDSIDPLEVLTYPVTIPANTRQIRVMVYWNDYEGAPNASTALVNNLDLQVITPTATYLPWVLDPSPNANSLSATAVRATDVLNNAEQVTIDDPDFTTMNIQITGTNIPFAGQEFVVVYEFVTDDVVLTYPIGGETLEPGTNEVIRWDASPGTSTFQVKYSTNGGSTWTTLSSNVSASLRYYSWTVPNNVSDEVLFTVSRGTSSDTSHAVSTIMEAVSGTTINSICPDTLSLSWNAVPGASHYIVTRLGAMYMDSVGVLSGTSGQIGGHDHLQDHYYALQPVFPSGRKGPRQTAFFVPAGLNNCVVDTDVAAELLSPAGNSFIQCSQSGAPSAVTIRVWNNASTPVSGIPVFYSLNGTTYFDTINQMLTAGQFLFFTFQDSIAAGVSAGTLQFGVSYSGDQDPTNNGGSIDFYWTQGVPATVPYVQNFDAFSLCPQTAGCATFCPLPGGWFNALNGSQDDIDWLAVQGSSAGGPSAGFGNSGRYLLMSPSACSGARAELYTPCFDLPANQVAYATFHTFRGSWGNTPDLRVDLISELGLILDVINLNATGTNGTWEMDTVNLAPYAGESVSLRFRSFGDGVLAFDEFEIQFSTAAPVAAAASSNSAICINETVTLDDLSTGFSSTRSWVVTPPNVQYVNGTDSTSAHPQIRFTQTGTYTIQLTVSSPYGSDSDVITGGVVVDGGAALPYLSNFDNESNCSTANNCGATFCPITNWTNAANGSEDQIDWRVNSGSTPSSNTGPTSGYGGTGKYLYLEASGTCSGQEARLISECIDLRNVQSAELKFYYHMFGTDMGDLYVDVISNGDYISNITPPLMGNQINQWMLRTVDLTPFLGTTVQLVFRGVTGSGYASDLGLDQITVNTGVNPPVSGISTTASSTLCVGETYSFSENATGTVDTYSWDFGLGANPATATGPGPINVTYNTPGTKSVTLTVQNLGGSDVDVLNLTVDAPTPAAFGTVYLGGNEWFFNPSFGAADSVHWNFGDGVDTTFADLSPAQHLYTTNGIYTVTQIVYSPCGNDTATAVVEITEVGTTEWNTEAVQLRAFPNPTTGNVFIELGNRPGTMLRVQLFDAQGRLIWEREEPSNERSALSLSLKGLAPGNYWVDVQGLGRVAIQLLASDPR